MFKIGEFSTLARVSIHTLRHYDEIDLFKPAHVDAASGYRHYAIEQLADLNRILALRDLGFSLAEIAQLMTDDITAEEIQGMLRLRRSQIERQVQDAQGRLRRVAARLKQVEQRGGPARHEVVEKAIPAQPFLSTREPVPSIRTSGWLYYEIAEAVVSHRVPSLSHCMAIFHDPFFRVRDTDFELGYLLEEPIDVTIPLRDGRRLTVKRAEAVPRALTCLHRGPWPEIQLGFAALGEAIRDRRLRIAGRPRELYLNLVPPEDDERLVVEVQIPVADETRVGEDG
jgi:DNA-binding transcriptional MerR regulator/effector-binding domain-containing protein